MSRAVYGVDSCKDVFVGVHVSLATDAMVHMAGSKNVKNSRVVFVGDQNHADLKGRRDLFLIINELASPGDIVLLEGAQGLKPVSRGASPELRVLRNDLELMGWDDLKLLKQSHLIMRQLIELHRRIKSEPRNERTLSAQFAALTKENDQISMVERTERMIETIDELMPRLSGNKRKIFVFAGSRHFTDSPALQEYLGELPFSAITASASEASGDAIGYFAD